MQEMITPQVAALHPVADPQWLSLTRELPIDPGRLIVDPHHHLWGPPRVPYEHEQFLADATSGHRVVATVYVECAEAYRQDGPEELRSVGETEAVARLASQVALPGSDIEGYYAGIVSFVDLRLGARVQEIVEAHAEAAQGRLRGFRQSAAWDPHPEIRTTVRTPPRGLLAAPDFRDGFAVLQRLDLVFDAWCYFHQLDEVAQLAGAFPDARIVLDHVGGPIGLMPYGSQRGEMFELWRKGIRNLAQYPNVSVKIGGLGMRLFGESFHTRTAPPSSEELAQTWRPFIETTIEAFRPERAMFESNFPVDQISCSYTVLWNAFKRVVAAYSESEKNQMFSGTAAGVYRISVPVQWLPSEQRG